jgi:hypothetical protein
MSHTTENSYVETVLLPAGATLNTYLPSGHGVYMFALTTETVTLGFMASLSSVAGVYYSTIDNNVPVAIIASTSLINGAIAESTLTYVNGNIITIVFDTSNLGVTIRNDSLIFFLRN